MYKKYSEIKKIVDAAHRRHISTDSSKNISYGYSKQKRRYKKYKSRIEYTFAEAELSFNSEVSIMN